jgi:hypothetical protein
MGVKIHSTLGSVSLESQNVTGAQTLYIPSISGSKTLLTTDGDGSSLTGVQPFPSGTKMMFYQASAPTAWTQDTTASLDGCALRVETSTGGGSGGTHDLASPPSTSHTHTGVSHTHSTPSHSHSHSLSAGAHTLSIAEMPSHNHIQRWGNGDSSPYSAYNRMSSQFQSQNTNMADTETTTLNTGSGSSHSHSLSGSITSGGGGTSGSGGTGTTSSNGSTAFAPKYVNVIICTKD